MKPATIALVAVGGYLLYKVATARQTTPTDWTFGSGPQYGGTSQAGTSGTGVTNPITALFSGVSNIVSRIFAHPTSGPGNTPADPSASASRLPTVSEPPPVPLALPATSSGYFLPTSPELYLPNLGDPNYWWAGDAIDYYRAAPQDISGGNQNVSLDVPVSGWWK